MGFDELTHRYRPVNNPQCTTLLLLYQNTHTHMPNTKCVQESERGRVNLCVSSVKATEDECINLNGYRTEIEVEGEEGRFL